MNMFTHSALLDRTEDGDQMNTAFFRKHVKYAIVPTCFSEEDNSSGYYRIFLLVDMHCDS